MFVGHYSASLVARSLVPQAPFWLLAIAAQVVDIAWSLFIMAGIERMSFDESLASNPFVLEFIPYTHGLFPSFLWAALAFVLVRWILRFESKVAVAVALVVVSHWFLDFVVHRPDLHVFGDWHVGLGLWDYPVAALALELGIVVLAAMVLLKRQMSYLGVSQKVGVIGFAALLVALQLYTHADDEIPQSVEAFAMLCLSAFLVVPYLGYMMIDRVREREQT